MAAIDTVSIAIKGVELCFSFGKAVSKLCETIATADKDIANGLLQVNSYWVRLESQIGILQEKRVLNLLSYDRRVNFERLLAQLAVSFQKAELIFRDLEADQDSTSVLAQVALSTSKSNKIKYALKKKKQLDDVIGSLRTWSSLFDASWFDLTMQSTLRFTGSLTLPGQPSTQAIDTLRSLKDVMDRNERDTAIMATDEYELLQESFLLPQTKPIHCSSAYVAKEETSGRSVIIDRISVVPEADRKEVRKDIIKLARTLSVVDPHSFGLLACVGVIPPPDPQQANDSARYHFVFAWPEHCRLPKSLRSHLNESLGSYALQHRFEIAKSLAKSVMYVHNSRVVHKGVRPENVLVFRGSNGASTSFLIGFEQFRPAVQHTYRRGDMIWERNLYRHPERQGLNPAEAYRMEHDIYSLGVCLLEIGLWTSLTVTTKNESAVPEVLVNLARVEKIEDPSRRATRTKAILLKMADEELPGRMGEIYTEVTKSCLSCLDNYGEAMDLSDEHEGNSTNTGVMFVEDILSRLMEINV